MILNIILDEILSRERFLNHKEFVVSCSKKIYSVLQHDIKKEIRKNFYIANGFNTELDDININVYKYNNGLTLHIVQNEETGFKINLKNEQSSTTEN